MEVVGFDGDSRRQAHEPAGELPTIGELLTRPKQARSENADAADAEYAADGRPVRITLDRDKDAIDDEAIVVPAVAAVAARPVTLAGFGDLGPGHWLPATSPPTGHGLD